MTGPHAGGRDLHVAQIVTTLARGGAQATVLASLPGVDDGPDGVRVTVLAGPDDPGEGTWWPEAGSPATGAGCSARWAAEVVAVPSLHRRLRPLADLRTLVWLIRWLRRHRPDVVHTHSAKAGVLGRLAAAAVGIPAVHTVHGWSFAAEPAGSGGRRLGGCGRRAVRAGGILVERLLARLTRTLVVVTAFDVATGLGAGIGRPGQYQVIRSGIDLGGPTSGAVRRPALRASLGWADSFVVGTVGRLAPQKDLATLLDGFARADLANGLLVVVGAGPDEAILRRRAAEAGLGDRVRFLGHRDDADHIVAGFDLFALTSRWEGLPRALVEAVSAGVPVVATPVGGVPELITDGVTGSLVRPGDVEAVARVIREAAADPGRFQRMAATAAELTGGYTVATMRQDLRGLWCAVAARR